MATIATIDPLFATKRPRAEEALYEVVKGQRMEIPPMSIYASWITSRLDRRLAPFVDEYQLGRVVVEGLFILDAKANERRRPDLAFVSAETWPLNRPMPKTGDWAVIPNLAVEVISPSELFDNVLTKVAEYFHFGVQQVWLVIPSQSQVYVYDSPTKVRILASHDELECASLLPGFRLALASIFEEPTDNGKAAI
jgi:Uma2 family endonuclease